MINEPCIIYCHGKLARRYICNCDVSCCNSHKHVPLYTSMFHKARIFQTDGMAMDFISRLHNPAHTEFFIIAQRFAENETH